MSPACSPTSAYAGSRRTGSSAARPNRSFAFERGPLELVNGKALDGPSLTPKIKAMQAYCAGRGRPRRQHHVRNGGFTPLIHSAVYATTKAAVTTPTECLWGQLRELRAPVSASLLYPSTCTPGMLNTGIWRPGANRPDRYDRPGAAPKPGRDQLTPFIKRAESAGGKVVFAPLEEVADVCFDGIRDDTFWIGHPNPMQNEKIQPRAMSQIEQTPPDYLLADNLMTGRKGGSSE